MISFVARSSGLGPHLTAVRQSLATGLRPVALGYESKESIITEDVVAETHTNYQTAKQFLPEVGGLGSRGPSVSRSLAASGQRRYAHTDVKIPDFSPYRRASVAKADESTRPSADSRRNFTYVMMATAGAISVFAGKNLVRGALGTLGASADVLAMGQLEVKLSDIPEGKSATFKWRDKPLFIRHRTAEEIEKEQAVDPSILRDPEHDNDRIQKPEWLVVLGICTHLGCVPLAGQGEYGGYYCPCHGSHYDSSGRIRKGPAPLNLEVPEYSFMDDDTLIVG